MRVFMVTSEWPSEELPSAGSFVVQQVEFLRRAGICVDVFPFRGAKNPFNYARARRNARAKLRAEAFDLVHLQFGQSAAVVLPTDFPVVVTYHTDELLGLPSPGVVGSTLGLLLRLLTHRTARRADEVVVVSEAQARLLPRGVPYHVIPCGVDSTIFRPESKAEARAALGLSADERLILFSGSPSVRLKRFWLAERAVELLPSVYRARLITLSGMPRATVARYMNASDALVLTSAYEGAPCMVKEALACNLPVVGLPVGDVPEMIGQLEGCVLLENDDPETISAGIERALEHKEPFQGRSAMGDFEESLLVDRLIGVYERAISKRSVRFS